MQPKWMTQIGTRQARSARKRTHDTPERLCGGRFSRKSPWDFALCAAAPLGQTGEGGDWMPVRVLDFDSLNPPSRFTMGGNASSDLLKDLDENQSAWTSGQGGVTSALWSEDPRQASLRARCFAPLPTRPVMEWTLYFKNAGQSDTRFRERPFRSTFRSRYRQRGPDHPLLKRVARRWDTYALSERKRRTSWRTSRL